VLTDPDPNLSNLLRDEANTLITLGTAVLGVTATFGKNLLAPNGSASAWLLVAWVAVALSESRASMPCRERGGAPDSQDQPPERLRGRDDGRR